jgi:hypothetical protein
VLLRAQNVTAGLAVEVEDRGLGMSLADQDRVNDLLTDPDRIDVGALLRDGRIGLFVVSAIARRYGITVRLQTNIYGGIQAVVIVPQGLLGTSPQDREQAEAEAQAQAEAQQMLQTARPERVPALAAHAPAAIPAAAPYPTPPPVPATFRAEVPVPAFDHSGDSRRMAQAGMAESPHGPVSPVSAVPSDGPDTHHTADHDVRPQLPQRQRQTHLVPQLHEAPAGRAEKSAVGHDPGLMASFMRGVSLAETGVDEEDGLRGRTDSIS